MTDEERFYQERDQRTRECGFTQGYDLPVRVAVGADAANSVAGQAMVLALVNMLARLHRHLQLDIPHAKLRARSLVPATCLDEAAAALARAINPYIRLDGATASGHAIGIGADAPRGLPWYAGADGQIAIIDRQPVPVPASERLTLGTALAACLAAAALLRQVIGQKQRPVRLSAWNLREGAAAERGPDLPGPVDVGSVLQIGAGGVGLCLAYWLGEFGALGDWRVLDRDDAILHNTNRCLGLLAIDAGWPGGAPRNKAKVAAGLFGALPQPLWYHEFDHNSFKPDLILPLANEHDVREHVARRGEPLLLHATTSRAWEAQLHRHLADRDGCITCRMPDQAAQVKLTCATVPIGEGTSTDATLPFLAATAGLLLVAGLYRLQLGCLADGPHNFMAVCFNDVRKYARPAIYGCKAGCCGNLPPRVRRRIHSGRRWSHLDQAAL
jgi:hypothetical protein